MSTIMKKVFTVLTLDEPSGTYTSNDGPPCLLCEAHQRQPERAHLSLTFTVSLDDEKPIKEVLDGRGHTQRDGSVLKVWVRCCSPHDYYLDRIYNSIKSKRVVSVNSLRLHSYDSKEVAVST